MPDDAPVRNTFIGCRKSPWTCGGFQSALAALAACFRNKLVERGRKLRMRAHFVGARDEFAVDNDGGDRLDIECLRLLLGAIHLARYRERRVDILDLLAIQALARRPVEERLVVPQAHVLAVDRGEYLGR